MSSAWTANPTGTWCSESARGTEQLSAAVPLPPTNLERAASCKKSAAAALATIENISDDFEIEEWRLACRATQLVADKVALAHELRNRNGFQPEFRSRAAALSDEMTTFAADYQRAWLARNRPQRLHEVNGAIISASQSLQSIL